jgi:hypothetical protein
VALNPLDMIWMKLRESICTERSGLQQDSCLMLVLSLPSLGRERRILLESHSSCFLTLDTMLSVPIVSKILWPINYVVLT